MLTVWWARGQANSYELRTHGTICGAGHICCGRRRVRVVGRSRGTTWPARYLAPGVAGTKLHQQRLVRGPVAEQLSGRGLLGIRDIYKRTRAAYGHAAAPCAPFLSHLPAKTRRRFRQKNGASTKKALFYPSSAPSGVAPTTRIVISQKY